MNKQGGTPTPDGLARPGLLPDVVPTWLFNLLVAAVVMVVAYYVSRLTRRVLGRRIARRFQRPSVTRTVLRAMQGAILFVGALIALQALGFKADDLVISLSVFSAVLGFILAPIIGSVINGLFILSERPYEIGDMIRLVDTDTFGFVEDITLRYTKIFTLDNTFLIVPNGSIRERDVLNYSAEDSRTRLSLDVLVTYESDVAEARSIIEQAAREVDNVIAGGPDIRIGGARYPATPTCYIENFADNGLNLRVRYWVTEPYKLLAVRSKVQTSVWENLTKANVKLAYPHQHMVFDETSGELQVGLGDRNGDSGGPETTLDPSQNTAEEFPDER